MLRNDATGAYYYYYYYYDYYYYYYYYYLPMYWFSAKHKHLLILRLLNARSANRQRPWRLVHPRHA